MKILLIGEECLDVFIYGECKRLCPEAPVPVFNPIKIKTNSGMAGNTFANLWSLGGDSKKIVIDYVKNETPIKKIRYVDEKSGQQIIRVDENDSCARLQIEDLLTVIEEMQHDAVIFSDYCKGLLIEEDINKISESCHKAGGVVFMDTKKILGKWSENIDFVKINEKEYSDNLKTNSTPEKFCKNLIITLGAKGCKMLTNTGDTSAWCEGIASEVREVSGAGDTFFAAFILTYLKDKNIAKALFKANLAASIAVSHRGVVAVTKADLESKYDLIQTKPELTNAQE
jgi:D-beta-D-heptose 7-phosphate kinase/D-beta-D-heptose 1-phosphate adenosyltransferase